MTATHRPDDLTQLRAELAAQRVEIAHLKRRRRLPRRALPLLLVALLVALVPLTTLAANPFTDLNPDSPHNTNIDAIFNAGITTGCVPNAEYCPNGLVTREEMASFLARTAGVGGNPPVANARTAQTATTAGHASTADSATNATTVGGHAPSGLVRVARASSASLFTYGSTTLQTLQITAPAAGFVLVIATTNPFTPSGSACPCQVATRLRHTATGARAPDALAEVPGTPSGSSSTRIAITHVFPVAAGQQTFELLGGTITPAVVQHNPTITALYVPFGSTGAGTLETTAPTGPQPDPIVVP